MPTAHSPLLQPACVSCLIKKQIDRYPADAPREQVWKTSILGPTQAKVSVVWMLFKNKKEVRHE